MPMPPNIYPVIVFNLNSRIKEWIRKLDAAGQIDQDRLGHPYILKIAKAGQNDQVFVSRNNQIAHFLINTRSKKQPLFSWNFHDGFKRAANKPMQLKKTDKPAGERGKRERTQNGAFDSMVEQILAR